MTPCHCNRASALGGDCERQLVYMRTAWQAAAPISVELELLFEEGRHQEEAVLRDLDRAGVRVMEQQVSLSWEQFEISGHLDAVVIEEEEPHRALPLEIKSMSPHIWDTIAYRGPGVYKWEEVAPAFTRKPWLRKYFAQLQLYCLLKGTEQAILLAKNKVTGQMAQIDVTLDLAYAEELLQRAQRINTHVRAGTLPDRIPYDPDVCGKCAWVHLCRPEIQGGDPVAFLEDAQIEERLDRRAALQEAYAEYEDLDAEVKAWAKTKDASTIAVGDWLLVKRPHGKGVRVDISYVGPGRCPAV